MLTLATEYFTGLATLDNIIYLALTLAGILLITLPILGGMAYTTWFERKILGWMHLRHGPTETGPFGLLQPIADAVKLMFKEAFIPGASNKVMFVVAPMMVFVPALIAWAVMPFGPNPLYVFGIGPEQLVLSNINLGVLYLLSITSIEVYGILLAGWASNSKYPFLGAVRSGAQMVSYEVSMGLIVLAVILLSGSMNLNKIIEAQQTVWFFIPAFPAFVMFLVSILAETNRHPFDLPEAEAELVAGYNTEYSAMGFALFFLGEYIAMITMSAFTAILFLGGWLPPFNIAPLNWIPGVVWLFIKIILVLFFMVWARGTLPRYRYDQLMRLGWKIFLPLSFAWLIITAFAVKLLGNFAG